MDMSITVNGYDVEIFVYYTVTGTYRPVTFYHPEELPELSIEEVFVGNEKAMWLIDCYQDEITEACWKHVYDMKQEYCEA